MGRGLRGEVLYFDDKNVGQETQQEKEHRRRRRRQRRRIKTDKEEDKKQEESSLIEFRKIRRKKKNFDSVIEPIKNEDKNKRRKTHSFFGTPREFYQRARSIYIYIKARIKMYAQYHCLNAASVSCSSTSSSMNKKQTAKNSTGRLRRSRETTTTTKKKKKVPIVGLPRLLLNARRRR